MLRYARDMGILAIDRSNWYRVMTTIWGSIDREIRLVLKALKDHKNLADFIKRIVQTKYLIASFAKDLASNKVPYIAYKCEAYPSRLVYLKRLYNL